jgi:hypothetical protein
VSRGGHSVQAITAGEPIVLDDEGEEPVEDDTPVVIRKP